MKTLDFRFRRLRGPVLAALLAAWPAAAAAAGSAADSAAVAAQARGTLLRIRPSADARGIMSGWRPMFRGTLEHVSADSIWIVPQGTAAPRPLALADVHLETYAGRSHVKGLFAGAALGVFTGFAVGAVAALVRNAQPGNDGFADFAYIVYPLAGASVGLPLGAAVGGALGVDRWEPLHRP